MDLGLLQREAALRARVEVASYQLWERDAAIPTATAMGRLVTFLGYDPTPLPADFPRRLATLRRRLGLTQAALARRVRVDVSTISSWETGATRPSRPYDRRLVASLGPEAAAT